VEVDISEKRKSNLKTFLDSELYMHVPTRQYNYLMLEVCMKRIGSHQHSVCSGIYEKYLWKKY
jgi:hypothetical protein